jgi:hypothetical protein
MTRSLALTLAATILLATAGPAPAMPLVWSDNCQVDVEMIPTMTGNYAVLHVISKYGLRTHGTLETLVDDMPYKTDQVDTTSEQVFVYRVSDAGQPVTTCSEFVGRFTIIGDNERLATENDCASVAPALAPPQGALRLSPQGLTASAPGVVRSTPEREPAFRRAISRR